MLRRILLLLALVGVLALPALADELEETVLYSGEAIATQPWTAALEISTLLSGGTFDSSDMRRGGYFTVAYEGTERAVTLSLIDLAGETLASVNLPAISQREGTHHLSTFTFDQCEMQYGSMDFSAVAAIRIGASAIVHKKGLIVQKVSWHGYPQDAAGITLFSGEAASSARDTNMVFLFTKHVGGGWDASQINQESGFEVTYAGPKNGVYLALSSHSGATQWARIDPAEITEADNGCWTARFDYDAITRRWGKNFTRLDQVSVFSATAQATTVHRIVYIPGRGEPVDTSDGRWDRPDTGVAFIGDSICQNAKLIYDDWNGFLNRQDCANFGIGAQTTLECRARIGELCSRKYRQIVFLCGINDIGRHYYDAEIVGNYAAMIDALTAANPDIRIAIVSVLPTTDAFYRGMQNRMVRLNAALDEFASGIENVAFVNCYDDFFDTDSGYAKPELLSDGLHPNSDGYAVIAGHLAKILVPEQD